MSDPVDDPATAKVRAWLDAHLGRVEWIRRQPRWRPVSFAERGRGRAAGAVRARRPRRHALIFPLDHEMRLQDLMVRHGIPAARVHGWIDDPLAYVMDRVPGRNDFTGSSEAERLAVVDDYLQILARLHTLEIGPFVEGGIIRATTPAASGTFGMSRYERVFRSVKRRPDPFVEFSLAWLRRNPPQSQGRESVIVWDSGQFHHGEGGCRPSSTSRSATSGIRDGPGGMEDARHRHRLRGLPCPVRGYEELTGAPVDLPALQRHHFGPLTNQPAFGARCASRPASDLMTNLQWCCETNLFATEALAEILQIELPSVEMPDPVWSRGDVALGHLVTNLRGVDTTDEYLTYKLRTMLGWPATWPGRRRSATRSRRAISTTCRTYSVLDPRRGWRVRPTSSASCWPTPTRRSTTRR